MSTLAETLKAHKGLIVVRDIDYGHYQQFWLLDMTPAEFEAWWLAQPTFESNPDGVMDALFKARNQTPPPHSKLNLPGTFIKVEGEEDLQLWKQFNEGGRHYFANLCCEHDSFMETPDGRRLYHQGATNKDKNPVAWMYRTEAAS